MTVITYGGLTQLQESAVIDVLSDLNSQLNAAFIEVASSSRFYNREVRATVLANLDADKKRIERLAGELLDSVRAGTLAFANWANIATTTAQDIAYQRGLTGQWSLSGVLAAAVASTATDVKEGAAGVVNSVGGGAGAGFIVGIAIAAWIASRFR